MMPRRSRIAGPLLALGAAVGLTLAGGAAAGPRAPDRPRAKVEIPGGNQPGKTLRVGPAGDFAAALRDARPGDVIELAAGAVFEGPFTLPAKDGAGWIVFERSSGRRLGTVAGDSFGDALVIGGRLFVSPKAGRRSVRAIDLKSGAVRWEHPLATPPALPPRP